jgi:hypothetical protein
VPITVSTPYVRLKHHHQKCVMACPRIMSTDVDGLTCKIPMSRCSSLITSAALLDNMMPFQLELAENIAAVLLTLSKNVLELWLLREWH